jgi:choline dehydrogenase-like flavoprotein
VGAGPAGIAIANRLNLKRTDRKVLLIEAGDAPAVDVVVRNNFNFFLIFPIFDVFT